MDSFHPLRAGASGLAAAVLVGGGQLAFGPGLGRGLREAAFEDDPDGVAADADR